MDLQPFLPTNLVVVHLKLKKCSEKQLDVFFVCVDNDVVYFFILYFSQDSPVVGWVGLSDVDLNILGGRRADQLLQSDQPVLVLVEDGHPGPVEE